MGGGGNVADGIITVYVRDPAFIQRQPVILPDEDESFYEVEK